MQEGAEMLDIEVEHIIKTIGTGKLCLEIGCYAGKLTLALAKENEVIAVDPFLACTDTKDLLFNEDMDAVKKLFLARIEGKHVEHHCVKSEYFYDVQHYDVLIIDGDHTKEGLAIDVNFISAVKEGGYIILHDNWEHFPHVQNACKELEKHFMKLPSVGSLAIFRKLQK